MPNLDFVGVPRSRVGTRLRSKAQALLAVALVGWLLTACGNSNEPSSTNSDSTPDPVSVEATTQSTSPTPVHSDEEADQPSGEVWQWAFGQNVWEDPLLTISQEQHFSPGNTDIYANTMGFSLTPDEQGTVVIVTLFNEDTGMVAYPGQLPGGLDWSMTGGDLMAMLGQESLSAIDGVPFSFSAVTNDGYDLELYVAASHMEDLPAAPLSSIIVRPSQ